ncbi:MAG TPA: class I SAM-dependent methyltransferase [Geobacterales bacterium]|nr:class I SAM-dependent methyltransferase [Geobacterales bacterium]
MSQPWYLRKEYVEGYEDFYETKYKKTVVLEKECLSDALKKLGEVKSLLEVGCGTSYFTRWFEKTFNIYAVGMDISPLMLKEAKKRWNGDLVQGESHYLPFRSEAFDAITFITCMEYMPRLEEVIREASRVARKGLILGLMNRWSLPTLRRMIQIALGKNPYYTNTTFYSIRGISKKLKQALNEKFKIIYWNTTGFPRIFGNLKSKKLPFGAFLCLGVKIEHG